MNTPADDSKLESLREEGTLHPHPEDVRDGLLPRRASFSIPTICFRSSTRCCAGCEKERSPITEASAAFGFSRPSFYLAQTAFQRGGLGGLVGLKRGPKGAHKLTSEVMDFVAVS